MSTGCRDGHLTKSLHDRLEFSALLCSVTFLHAVQSYQENKKIIKCAELSIDFSLVIMYERSSKLTLNAHDFHFFW